jgi:uncharacterized membrane protein
VTNNGFRYSITEDRIDWFPIPDDPTIGTQRIPAFYNTISDDGNVILGLNQGVDALPSPFGSAFRWTVGGGVDVLSSFPSTDPGVFYDISDAELSGSGTTVIVDAHICDDISQICGDRIAARWTNSNGLELLGTLNGDHSSEIRGSNYDGTVIVGQSKSFDGIATSFRWTAETGMIAIGSPSWAAGRVSRDGRVIIQSQFDYLSLGSGTATLWTEEQGVIQFVGGRTTDLTSDGSVVIGFDDVGSIVWDARHGRRSLNELLVNEYGLASELEGWQELYPFQIADDGLTLSGRAISPEGSEYIWLVDLDHPLVSNVDGDFNVDGTLDVDDLNRLASAVATGGSLTAYDLTGDGQFSADDLRYWTGTLAHTWTGDANLDGKFGSADLVAVFQAGKYEAGEAARWTEGDWNGDGIFSTRDLVMAFQDGGYEQGPRESNVAVPELASCWLLLTGGAFLVRRRRDN